MEPVEDIERTSVQELTLSPELALVDPELAAVARASLPSAGGSRSARVSAAASDSAIRSIAAAAAAADDRDRLSPDRLRSRRLLLSVAAATIMLLLFVNVRIEVGERPASADTSTLGEPSPPATSTTQSTPPPAQQPPVETLDSKPDSRPRKPTERRFAWAPAPGASGYHVEFFRGETRVFAQDTRGPELTVPAQWTHRGVVRALRPGQYEWYVWPIVDGRRASRAVVQAQLAIPGN